MGTAVISATICWIVVFAKFTTVHGSPSTLKVAVCNPGQLPYANVDKDGNLEGFDIGCMLTVSLKMQILTH